MRDKESVMKDFAISKQASVAKAIPSFSVDGDHSWFCNPQYRIRASKPEIVYFSLVPLVGDAKNAPTVGFSIVTTPKENNHLHIWDLTSGHVLAHEAKEGCGKVKGQECSLWKFHLDPKYDYHIIPNTTKKSMTGSFILRVFSHNPILLEKKGHIYNEKMYAEWKKSTELDLCGGPLFLSSSDEIIQEGVEAKKILIENSRWGQNPQIHFKVKNITSKEPVNIKFVLRKTDKSGAVSHEKSDHAISFIVCKPEFVREVNLKKKKSGSVRENALGNPLPSKPTTLKKERQSKYLSEMSGFNDMNSSESSHVEQRQILKKVSLANDILYFQSSASSKYEACIFFPNFPRQILSDGLMIIPSLDDKGVKGHFLLEAYASEEITLTQLSDKKMKVLAGEWDEKTAFGSQICPSWKKNPKYSLKFKPKSNSTEKFKITLYKFGGDVWKKNNRLDHIGSMIGFHIFLNTRGDISPYYESPYVPDREISTDDGYALEILQGHDDEYISMPTTFSEGIKGMFVLSVSSECDFTLVKKSESK